MVPAVRLRQQLRSLAMIGRADLLSTRANSSVMLICQHLIKKFHHRFQQFARLPKNLTAMAISLQSRN
jgi:hypothetical protein